MLRGHPLSAATHRIPRSDQGARAEVRRGIARQNRLGLLRRVAVVRSAEARAAEELKVRHGHQDQLRVLSDGRRGTFVGDRLVGGSKGFVRGRGVDAPAGRNVHGAGAIRGGVLLSLGDARFQKLFLS